MKTLEKLAEEFCANPPPGVSGSGFINVLVAFHKHALDEKIKSVSKMDVGPVEYRVEPIEYLRGYDRAKKQAIEILKQPPRPEIPQSETDSK